MSTLTPIPDDGLESVSGGGSTKKTPAANQSAKPARPPSSLDITNGGIGHAWEELTGLPNPDDSGKYVNGTRASKDMLDGFGTVVGVGHR